MRAERARWATARGARDQRWIRTRYLKYLGTKCSVFRAQPDRVSTLPEIFGSVATRVSSPRPVLPASRNLRRPLTRSFPPVSIHIESPSIYIATFARASFPVSRASSRHGACLHTRALGFFYWVGRRARRARRHSVWFAASRPKLERTRPSQASIPGLHHRPQRRLGPHVPAGAEAKRGAI